MASIKIAELRPAGSELFQDAESFLNELSEKELSVQGGGLFFSVVEDDQNNFQLTKNIAVQQDSVNAALSFVIA